MSFRNYIKSQSSIYLCLGERCELKNTCIRYLEFQKKKENKDNTPCNWITNGYDSRANHCYKYKNKTL